MRPAAGKLGSAFRNPPASYPTLSNGDFARNIELKLAPSEIYDQSPGWSFHGGGGTGSLLGKLELRFDNSVAQGISSINLPMLQRAHNPSFIPPEVTHLQFQLKRPRVGSNPGNFKVVANIGSQTIPLLDLPLSTLTQSTSTTIPWSIRIPESLKGKVASLSFSLSASNASPTSILEIDDLHYTSLVKSGM